MQMHINKEFAEFGFGSGQYMHFIHISYNEGITQKELSRALAIDKGTTAKAAEKLTRLGYIVSKKDENDGRSYKLYLTKAGKSILPKARKILNGTSGLMKADMIPSEELSALSSLKKMAENIRVSTSR
jgi:DNA-binding MarR family transcriptional regulator